MTATRRCSASLAAILLLCLPLAAQDREAGIPAPPAPDTANATEAPRPDAGNTPQTVIEQSSPATFGATVVTGADGRLVIGNVVEGSAAQAAGLRADDQLISINGQAITEPDEFYSYLASHPADSLQLVVVRDGSQQTVAISQAASAPDASASRPALGVRFVQGNSVILADVLADSPAERAGLLAGDQVVAVNDTVVSSSDHFISLVAAADPRDSFDLTYVRGQFRDIVTVELAPWDVVFGTGHRHTSLRPNFADPAAPVTYYVPDGVSYAARMSPVGVPSIAFPTYYGRPYGYTYWGYPYYGYFSGLSTHPNWYLHAWPAGGYYGGCYGNPAPVPSVPRTDSSAISPPVGERVADRVNGEE